MLMPCKVLMTRRSVRDFTSDQISEEDCEPSWDAGLHAASAMNRQSWHLTVVQDKLLPRCPQRAVRPCCRLRVPPWWSGHTIQRSVLPPCPDGGVHQQRRIHIRSPTVPTQDRTCVSPRQPSALAPVTSVPSCKRSTTPRASSCSAGSSFPRGTVLSSRSHSADPRRAPSRTPAANGRSPTSDNRFSVIHRKPRVCRGFRMCAESQRAMTERRVLSWR